MSMQWTAYLAVIVSVFFHTTLGVNVTIVTMIEDEGHGKYTFHLKKTGPLIDIALEKIRKTLQDIVNLTYVQRVFPSDSCYDILMAVIASELYYGNNVSALIGPGCSPAVGIVGRMASVWNVPMISPVATDGKLSDKNAYGTLTRLSYTMDKWVKLFVALFDKYSWNDIAIIYDTDYVFFEIVAEELVKELPKNGRNVFTQSYTSTEEYDIEKMLLKARAKSRVFIIECYGNHLRQTMLLAHKHGMTSGEYVFVFARIFIRDNTGDTSWYRGDDLDETAKKAYEAILITEPKRPTSSEFQMFENEVKMRAKRDYNFSYGDDDVNLFHMAYHDSYLVYAAVLKETLATGEDFTDGRLMNRKLWGKRFKGISGDIIIDKNGDREMPFSLLDANPVSGNYQVVASYSYVGTSYEFKFTQDIHWPNNAGPPLNIPRCGFLGDAPECQDTDITTEIMISGIVGGFSVVFIIVTAFIYRKFKLESDLQSQWWKIKWKDLEPVNHGSTIGSRLTGTQSSRGDLSKTDAIMAKKLYRLKGISVVAEFLNMETLKTDRTALMQLKQMRDIPCPNLARFYGLCADEGHISVMWEHCSRGNLQDMLHNDAIKLDKEFKLSLMYDIISGMCYIHDSPIGSHGRLNSANCYIDGRFVLKIKHYGLQAIQAQENISEDVNKYSFLYVAPEHLKDKHPYRVTSQPGDVYSSAIVLYELMTRREPFEDILDTYNLNDVLDKIKTFGIPIRPKTSIEEIDQGLVNLMDDCWRTNPDERPTFGAIKRKFKEMFQLGSGKNILDTLLQRMEQYANNLEGLVEERTQAFLDEKRKSEELLLEILPKSVADKLKNGHSVDPESYESVTIYFSDIVGFTSISALSSPMQVIDFLNDLYTCFDAIIDNFDVYKVETIGDAYMVVSGLPATNGKEHVRQIAQMSLSILENVKHFKIRHLPGTPLKARIGIHTGPVCSGVVGKKMPRYCLFGDTVNTASRMESNGEAMKIHISASTWECLSSFGNFVMQERGEIEVKGKGVMKTFWLQGEQPVESEVRTLIQHA